MKSMKTTIGWCVRYVMPAGFPPRIRGYRGYRGEVVRTLFATRAEAAECAAQCPFDDLGGRKVFRVVRRHKPGTAGWVVRNMRMDGYYYSEDSGICTAVRQDATVFTTWAAAKKVAADLSPGNRGRKVFRIVSKVKP